MKISGIYTPSSIKLSPDLQKVAEGKEAKGAGFGEMLAEKINEVDHLQKASDTAVQDFATGKSQNLHEAVLALEMADTSLRMLVTVRNKALEAYNEIMKMPV